MDGTKTSNNAACDTWVIPVASAGAGIGLAGGEREVWMIVSSTQAESDRQPLERQGSTPRPNAPQPARRKPLRLAAPALLALLAALAAGPAAAQTVTTLVSNIGQTQNNTPGGTNERAQVFTTGSNATGYTLSSIDIVSADTAGDSFAVSLYTTNASGHPDTLAASLTVPGSFAAGTLTFTAPASTTLAASTGYAVRITPGSASVDFGATTNNAEDSGAGAGWSIANAYHFPDGGSWTATGSGVSLRIAIKGYANTGTANNAPVFNPSAVSRSVAENTAAGQNVGDPVTATDADTGDTLGYTLGGADAASFDIVAASGQIRTKTGVTYDHSAAAATANHEAAKEWDELATHADLCRADIGAGRSSRERLAEFFATCLCGSLLPYAIACGAKVQEGVSSLNGTVLLPGPRCKDPYV